MLPARHLQPQVCFCSLTNDSKGSLHFGKGLYRVQERDTECDELSSCRSVNLELVNQIAVCGIVTDFSVEDAFPGTCVTRELQTAGLWPPKGGLPSESFVKLQKQTF